MPKQLVISGPDSIFENKDFYLHRHIRGRYSAVEKGVFFSPVQDGDAMGKAWDLSRTDFYELDPPQKAKCPPSRGTQISRLREKNSRLRKKCESLEEKKQNPESSQLVDLQTHANHHTKSIPSGRMKDATRLNGAGRETTRKTPPGWHGHSLTTEFFCARNAKQKSGTSTFILSYAPAESFEVQTKGFGLIFMESCDKKVFLLGRREEGIPVALPCPMAGGAKKLLPPFPPSSLLRVINRYCLDGILLFS